MKPLTILLTASLISCSITKHPKVLFDDLVDQESVIIILSHYGLKGVPSEISRLKKVKRLSISSTEGYTLYPPLGLFYPQDKKKSFSSQLPNEITELTDLKYLSLANLNLENLPKDFNKLQNLDTLDLRANRLIFSKEIEKLKDLKGLKLLLLWGNLIESRDIDRLKMSNPNLTIEVWPDVLSE